MPDVDAKLDDTIADGDHCRRDAAILTRLREMLERFFGLSSVPGMSGRGGFLRRE